MENEDIQEVFSKWSFLLDSAIPKCSESDMDKHFLELLENAYRIYPFHINSAYRTSKWERDHKRAGTSAHCKGRAVDIATPDSRTRWFVINALLLAGFTRIGIGKTFVHVDNDVNETRPDKCIFLE